MYRVPVAQNDDGSTMTISNNASGDTIFYNGAASVVYVPKPPLTIAQAQLFPGTRAWEAAKGSYNVGVFNTPDVPATGLNFTQPAMYTNTQLENNVLFAHTSRTPLAAVNSGVATVPNVSWTEMNMSGTFFTGLSNSTTLTINYIVYIERFPTQDDLDLIVSAKRSPEYDIKALELYSEISQSLPVAVTFNENGWGDLWGAITGAAQGALNVARKYVAPVVSYFGGARGQAIGAGIEGVGQIADAFDQPPSDFVPSAPRNPPMVTPGRMRAPRGPRMARVQMQLPKRKKGVQQRARSTKVKASFNAGLLNEINDVRRKIKQKGKQRRGY